MWIIMGVLALGASKSKLEIVDNEYDTGEHQADELAPKG